MLHPRCDRFLAWAIVGFLLTPAEALAYVGPGSGITAIGAALALVGTIVLALVGFVWYPVKRLIGSVRRSRSDIRSAAGDASAR